MSPPRPPRPAPPRPGRAAARGALGIYLVEVAALPAGLVTTIYLSHRFGPDRYGQYALAVTLVVWLEMALSSVLAKATVRLVADTPDWRPVATTSLRTHLALALPVAAALWLGADLLAARFHDPVLGAYFRLLAIDVPLFSAGRAHRHVLVGRGAFAGRAVAGLARWSSRLVLVVVLVEAGLGVEGAILGGIGASLVETVVARRFVRPPLRGPGISAGALLLPSLPLFVHDVSVRLLRPLGFFGLKLAGVDAAEIGCYGAAMNLTIPFGLVAVALSPVLLSTLSRLRARGDAAGARSVARNALRATFVALPLAAIAGGAADGIVDLLLAPEFAGTSPLLGPLALAAACVTVLMTCTATLVASKRTGAAVALAVPPVALAAVALAAVLPAHGAVAASRVTVSIAAVAAATGLGVVAAAARVPVPVGTLARSVAIGAAAWGAAMWWNARGAEVVLEVAVLTALVATAYVFGGELEPSERAAFLARLRRRR